MHHAVLNGGPSPDDGCWPTPEQELLLQAALLRGDRAIAAWESWRARAKLDTLDLPSRRLEPLLYRNLHRHGVSDPLVSRFKESYSRTHFKNVLLFKRSAEVLRLFRDEGIRTIALKGSALVAQYYGEIGLRPMQDLDVLVPAADAERAMRMLRQAGWLPTYHARAEKRIAHSHSTPFGDSANRQIDLHWHVLADGWGATNDDAFWRDATPLAIEGETTLALSPTHQLLHLCVHGVRWDEPSSIRWFADARTLLDAAGGRVDWDALVSEARARHLTLPLGDGFEYLRAKLDAPIPERVVAELRATPVSALERKGYELLTRVPRELSATEVLSTIAFDFQRSAMDAPPHRRVLLVARRLQDQWGTAHLWQLPIVMAQGVGRRLRREIGARAT